MSNAIILPRHLQIGKHASHELPAVLTRIGCQRPLIVTDEMMVSLGYIDELSNRLNAAGIIAQVFDQTVPEPTVASVDKAVEFVQAHDFDCLVAVGGGSPIDSAKAVAVLAKLGGQMSDYKVPRVVDEPVLPIIAIPTTAGTGSEATRVTVITDEATDEKMLCMGSSFMPIAALVDYQLSLSLPPRTTADTGIDALTHAMEAYVSRKANTYSDSQAMAAMRLMGPNLRKAYHDGADEAPREAMMAGATLAGIAFSNASVALVHGMSRPIGAFFHVPHGLSNAMLLPSVTEYSLIEAEQRYAECAIAIGVAEPNDTIDVANQKLIADLYAINQELNVPTLAEFGVEKTYFDQVKHTMAEQALESGSPGNNPRIPSVDEMVEIYDQLWV